MADRRALVEAFVDLMYRRRDVRTAFDTYVAEDYVQHNPNAGQGLTGVQDYIRKTRPERPIEDTLELPLINLIAERDYVMTAFVRPEKDATGATYYSTWFDLYRIEDGKIAEHWDPMLKSDVPVDPNEKKL